MGLLWLFFLHLLVLTPWAEARRGAQPGCPDKCGDIAIPYPFGIAPGCSRPGFRLTCIASDGPPKLVLPSTGMPVTEIRDSELVMQAPIARRCYKPLNLGPDTDFLTIDVRGTPFTLSNERNKFTVIGCDTDGVNYQGMIEIGVYGGCMSICIDPSVVANGTCDGIGCCQVSIVKGLQLTSYVVYSTRNQTATFRFNPCSFAFLIEQDSFSFKVTDMLEFVRNTTVPVVLDWVIGSKTCGSQKGTLSYACGANTTCVDAPNGNGYNCRCDNGYQGNPYLSDGCQDIDECADPAANPCSNICTNYPGGFACSCPKGQMGDGKRSGSGCYDSRKLPLIQIILGVGLGSVFLIVVGSWGYWGFKKRRMLLLRENFFKQNGGLMLQQRISAHGNSASGAMIFTAEELEKATDNYSDSRILGKGGYGTVYKGILPDKRVVAIKKSKVVDETQVEQFINEIVVLSQVIHRNVVKILGCCLETQVPLLVYEYIPNGTLTQHLRDPEYASSLPWEIRLRIAAETAGALAYLHSSAALPIVHRDVKTANILLDGDFTAKVSDFGASRLIPMGKGQINTLVMGTMGYLDPEYFQTGLLTESSDVYSFGVVLAELLTGQKPLSTSRPEEEQNLAIYFLRAVSRNRLRDILEHRIRHEGSAEVLEVVAKLAEKCLSLSGSDRPTMKDVAAELQRLQAPIVHAWQLVSPRTSEAESEVPSSVTFSEENGQTYYTAKTSGQETRTLLNSREIL